MLGYAWAPIVMQGDGPALTASTTPTTLIGNTGGKWTQPTNFLSIGTTYHIRAAGRISTVVTTPGTLTIDIRLGAVVVATSQALALNIVAKTNVTWIVNWEITCRAIGGSTNANFMQIGRFESEAVIGSPLPSVGGSGVLLIPASAPAVGTGFDSTAAQQIDFFGTWSLNNANSIQMHQFSMLSMN